MAADKSPSLRAAIYARVSTTEQDSENQIAQIKEYCSRKKFRIVKIYTDTASGTRSDRAEFKAMMDGARRHQFDVLVFWSLDRISREGVLRTLQHLHTLSEHGVKWHSLQESYIDSLGPFGDAVVGFIATVAQMERDRLAERTRAGIERARQQGKQIGRPKTLISKKSLLKMLKTKSIRACARHFGVSPGTIMQRRTQWDKS